MKDKTSLLRSIAPALIAGALYGSTFALSGLYLYDPKVSWTPVALFCAGAVVAFILGALSKSIGIAILSGFLLAFIAMIILHLMFWVVAPAEADSFWGMLLWGVMYGLLFSTAGMLLSTIGHGAKLLFQAARSKNRQA